MAQYISTLLHDAGGDFSRPTKFAFFINSSASGNEFDSYKELKDAQIDIITKDVQIPSITASQTELNIQGHPVNMNGRVNFEKPLTVTFYLDEKHKIYQMFYEWMMLSDKHFIDKNSSQHTPKEFSTTIVLSALNWDEDTALVDYKFFYAYPTSVTSPQYSTDGVGQIQEITVTFDYSIFTTKPTDEIDWSNIGSELLNAGTEYLGDLLSPSKANIPQTSANLGGDRDFFG